MCYTNVSKDYIMRYLEGKNDVLTHKNIKIFGKLITRGNDKIFIHVY